MAKEPFDAYDEEYEDGYEDEPRGRYGNLVEDYGEEYYTEEEEAPPPPPRKPGGKKAAPITKKNLMLIGSFIIAAVLLVSVVVMSFGNIVKPSSSVPVAGSTSGAVGESVPDISASVPTEQPLPGHVIAEDPSAWNLQIISAAYPVDTSYQPPELDKIPQNSVEYWFDVRIMDSMLQMLTDCNAVSGHSLRLSLGYRSFTRQQELFNYYYNNYKGLGLSDEEAIAKALEHEPKPGTTEHHTGLAADFVTGSVQTPGAEFANTAEYAWLVENCVNYGFILRYPADRADITGVGFVPYHFRYVGVEEAKAITDNGLTLEQYCNKAPTPAA